jgi:uncharacterized protein (DUF1501 family)
MDQPEHNVNRRKLLELGAIGILGLGLPRILQARLATKSQKPSELSCIFIVQYGGCSHLDTFDPKPDAPVEVRGHYKTIATAVPGIRICELLPRLAAMADRYCLIRSMSHGDANHDGGMHVCMTGHSKPAAEEPYYGAVMARLRPAARNVPPYVWVQNLAGDVQPRYLTGGFLGVAYSPLRIGTDLDNPSAANFRVRAFDTPLDVSLERLHERWKLLNSIDSTNTNMRRFQEQAIDLLAGPEARRAFDLEREPATLRDRYGRHPLGQNPLLARRLIESGVRLVSVTAWAGTPAGEKFRNVQTWDMHGEGAGLGSMFGTGAYGLGWALPNLDQAVSALLEDLQVRGRLDNTLVVLVGEFGRAPRVDRAGRDHWPACYSALLAGAGIKGRLVYGCSDRRGAYVRGNPVTPERFGATLYHALGVPPETRLAADVFTRPASVGQPILELFS